MEQRLERTDRLGSERDVGEGLTSGRRISLSNFSGREKGRDQQACHQSKNPHQICDLPAFQIEGFAPTNIFIIEWRLHVENRFKRCIFQCALYKNSRKLLRFRWKRNLYEFLCLCFGLGPAPRAFT